MKIFLFVLLVGTYSDGSRDLYSLSSPTFESKQECLDWGQNNIQMLGQRIADAYRRPVQLDKILCIREDRIKDVIRVVPEGTAI